jgi:hypothetical protein
MSGDLLKPFLDRLVLIGRSYAGGANLEICHGGSSKQPFLLIVSLAGGLHAGHGVFLRGRGEEAVSAGDRRAAAFGEIGVRCLGNELSQMCRAGGSFFFGLLFDGIDDGVIRVDVITLGIDGLGQRRQLRAVVRRFRQGNGSVIPR